MALFFQSAPPSPPSCTSDHDDNGMTIWQELKFCLTKKDFLILLTLLSAGFAVFLSLFSIMQQVVGSTHVGAYIGIAMVGAGVIGSIIVGVLMDMFRIYRPTYIIFNILGTGSLLLFWFGLPCRHDWLIGAGAAVGFFFVSLLPLSLELAVEVSFPGNVFYVLL